MNMKMRYLLLALLISAFTCATALAQGIGQINGNVTDSAGALIPGVEVTATQTATGISRMTLTNERGAYILSNLPIGPYKVEAALAGFRTFVQSGITLEVNANLLVNITLEVGQITESVEVKADALMVETRATGVGQVINNTQILELPLVGRSTQDLITLVGGAVVSGQETATSRSFTNIARFTIAGSSDRGNSYTLDGASHNEMRGGLGLPLPFPDALQEFKVETSALPAQIGFHSGGAINAVTKSGTNDFHGGLFWFGRNQVFNARNFFSNTRDPLKRNQFGGTVGGPIQKNKMFFFFGMQETLDRRAPSDTAAIVPTAAMINGDFSKYASAACQGSNVALPAPFVNGVAPASALSPAAVKMAKLLPVPKDDCGNTTFGIPLHNNEGQYAGKVDLQLNAKQSMFWRYFAEKFSAAVPTSLTNNALATGTPGKDDLFQAGTVGHTLTVGTSIVNTFRASWNRIATRRVKPTYFDASDLGINAWSEPALKGMLPVTVTGDFVVGSRTSAPNRYRETGAQLADDLGIIRGDHQLNFGFSFHKYQQNSTSLSQIPGLWTFNGTNSVNAMANFMLGNLSILQQGGANPGDMRFTVLGTYAQDSWKVKSNVTLSAGVRWEPFIAQTFVAAPGAKPIAVNNYIDLNAFLAGQRTTQFTNAPAGIFYQGDPQFPKGGNPSAVTHNSWLRFAPRVGLTWDPMKDGKMVVRAAYGVFYEQQRGEFGISYGQGPPWGGFSEVNNVRFDDPYANTPGGSPFPFVVGPNAPYPLNSQFDNSLPSNVPPYVQQWNVAIQREVAKDMLVSITYLGNEMVHQYGSIEINPGVFIPGNADASGICNTTVMGRAASIRVAPNAVCSTPANQLQRRLFTLLDPTGALGGAKYGFIETWDSNGTRSYNGLLLSVIKRMSHNFSVTANYTWSHCIGDQANNFLNSNPGLGAFNDPNNRRYDRGNCAGTGDDIRHIANSTAVIHTPRFTNRSANAILGDWSVSGILRARSGFWQSALVNSETSGGAYNINNQRANLVSSNVYGNQCKTDLRSSAPTCNWYNKSAFAVPTYGTLGNSGKNMLQGPGSWAIDFGLDRVFRITEGQAVELRMEASNILNHTNFNAPNSNINSTLFGRLTSAADPRIIQFGMRYTF